ncbi:sulfotransferase [Frankia sp. CNm7]|uniref:Sulfotransferase n=1 Tax=Frankia nepalensis TaxID=1836974 RepID=A0A937RF25_9ACTN|nr:sulfotransferase [Frankia nepalensis]MBL7502723.1 sulfotransferase [Frankia nepalensis]MBL7515115.1 sulfotransferase [Frankia nepalensis]MBL7521293.1 sulfotransferase [Frankia nepalensis]MBL7629240.1 sulfotransferase [Frankia nepalensis]
MAVKVLRVEGMRADTRTPAERAALEADEARPLDMSIDAVLEGASRQTGLDDFGSLDFTQRLGPLLAEVEADANVWRTHKATFVHQCVQAAANRLLIQRYWNDHPACLDAPIERPINVIALPRSGSTHLENLLAADRRLRHLPVYLAAQPAPSVGETPGPDGVDPRWSRSNVRWQRLSTNEIFAAMHEHSPDHACGENELQVPDFASYQWEWMANVPGYRDHYLSHDQTPHYRYMKDVLRAIAWQFPSDRRWMLKSNQHSEQLGPLMATYPDVTVVMIHRDPVATIQSLLTMRGLALKMSQKRPDIDAHVGYWVDRLERMLRSYLRDRHLVPDGQLVELRFDEIVGNDVQAAAGVLERAGLTVTDETRADIEHYVTSHPRGSRGRVVYDLEGDFGLDPDELRDRFAFYTDTFQIRPEVGKERAR